MRYRYIEVDGKVLHVAFAKQKVRAFLIDAGILCIVSLLFIIAITVLLKNLEAVIPYDQEDIRKPNFGDAIGCGDLVGSVYVWIGENVLDVDVAHRDEWSYYVTEDESVFTDHNPVITNIVIHLPFLFPFLLPLWLCVLFSDWSVGKQRMSLHVLSWKDMKSRSVFWIIEHERERVREPFPKKVVVVWDPKKPALVIDTPDKMAMDALTARRAEAKQQLETAIAELTARVADATQQVQTSGADARKFQVAYEDAITEAEAAAAVATRAVEDGREAAARDALERRNDAQRIADRNRTRYEQQQAVVNQHTTLLETLELQTAHIQSQLNMVVAKHTNVDAETQLSDILKEIEAYNALKLRLFDITHQQQTDTAGEHTLAIAGEPLSLASRMTQLYMFFWDIVVGFIKWAVLAFLLTFPAMLVVWIGVLFYNILGLFGIYLFGKYPDVNVDVIAFSLAGVFTFYCLCLNEPDRLFSGTRSQWIQVLHKKTGQPVSFIAGVLRRFCGLLQPMDLLYLIGPHCQRLGDKIAQVVAVKRGPLHEQTEAETESPEAILAQALTDMKPQLAAAREKVNAAANMQRHLQATSEIARNKADQQQANTRTALETGHEDTARDALEKRNAYQFLAEKYKIQAEAQHHVVKTLRDLLAHFEDKLMEAEGQRAVVAAEQRNVETETHLREMLAALQQNKVEKVEAMEQDATAAANFAKAMVDLNTDYQDVKATVEFSGYAQDAEIEQELTEIKETLEK